MVTHGSDELRRRALRPMFTGEEIWCQLFSEPGAGSDLAGLATRAVRDGDEWVVNGQKVWNTLAHLADRGMLVARTDPELPEAQGPHVLHGRHARARRRGATAAPDHRRGGVQRGVPHRRAHRRRRSHRRHGRLALTVGYVGSSGVHLAHPIEDTDQVPPSLVTFNSALDTFVFPIPAPGTKPQRINPNFGQIASTEWSGHSTYHALQANLVQRPIKGLTYQIAYTWSKSIDNGSSTFSEGNESSNTAAAAWAF